MLAEPFHKRAPRSIHDIRLDIDSPYITIKLWALTYDQRN
jgi:hypothetical protein